jgi:HPr kinase/phosphorylase
MENDAAPPRPDVADEARGADGPPGNAVRRPSVSVAQLVDDRALGTELRVHAGRAGLDRSIRGARVQKPGLALVGHFHGVESWRLQILGATEISFLEGLDPEARRRACEGFAALRPCAIVVTRGVEPMAELVAACEATDTPLLGCATKSSTTINLLHARLDDRLAPTTRIHGVLVSIFGVGVLLIGKSGIGKSECALDLVMRGHRFVADDAVDCSWRPPGVVFGAAAPLLEHHIEIRGLGILDVKDLFGVTSICDRIAIDLVVRLEGASELGSDLLVDRLGLDERHHRILDVDIPERVVPVRPGRDIATILEIAARNELLKRAGHHGARAFRDRLEKALLGRVADSGDDEGTS